MSCQIAAFYSNSPSKRWNRFISSDSGSFLSSVKTVVTGETQKLAEVRGVPGMVAGRTDF